MMSKKIILTIDYELFFGERTGSVKECIIEPTEKLLKMLDNSNSSMTVFWDILHFYKLIELEDNHPELKSDRILIEKQIINMVKKGCDIQMHLHPHWLDAKYENSKWNFKYDRYKLHDLKSENNPNDINTILGCITISKKLMEDTIKKEKPDYKVISFRAGGYSLEPFDKIKDALLDNEIRIDSSVCPGLLSNNKILSYDFRFYPTWIKYNFSLTPKKIDDKGKFMEIPITTIKLSLLRNIYNKLLKKIKYPTLENQRKGSGVGNMQSKEQKTIIKKLIYKLFFTRRVQLTTDSNFSEKFNYLFKKAPDYSTMIVHPKLLNDHTLMILDDYLTSQKIQFIAIKNFVSLNIQ
jgi:hypothetical protein